MSKNYYPEDTVINVNKLPLPSEEELDQWAKELASAGIKLEEVMKEFDNPNAGMPPSMKNKVITQPLNLTPEQRKERVYNLCVELADAQNERKSVMKAHTENIKRIKAEIKDLIVDDTHVAEVQ